MIVLLAAGVGVSVLGLLAVGVGIPISDSSFGNALLIAGVVVLCTGLILIGMWFVGRELARVAKLLAQGARPPGSPDTVSIRPSARPPAFPDLLASPAGEPAPSTPSQPNLGDGARNGISPPWADEAASRSRIRPAAPEVPPVTVDPVDAPSAPPSSPDRPARRNLLFATRRRDKPEQEATPAPALESEPQVSFDNAWPNPSRLHGAQGDARTGHIALDSAPIQAQAAGVDRAEDVAVIKSGVVDGMAYTLYSDGSIEAQMAGEGLVRFASLETLRTYLDQRQ